jgi:asparagine synthase (glutamine-hydrolysing)
MRLGELNNQRFSEALFDRLEKSAEYLCQLIEPATGEVPLYGSNDGALVLPLNNCDYTDYRPVLQLTYYLTHGKHLFARGAWDEDLFWLYGESALKAEIANNPEQVNATFPDAGVYVLRGENSKVVMRCTDFRGRPSHADQLHMDFWWNEVNVACDAGTYLYHGEGIWQNGLARTNVHNTVCVDGMDQMTHLSRFTWANWAKGKVLRNGVFDGLRIWQGEHEGYRRLSDPVKHVRSVIELGNDRWLVMDRLNALQVHCYDLQWLLADLPYQVLETTDGYEIKLDVGGKSLRMILGVNGSGDFSIVRGNGESIRGWRSIYYGEKHPAVSVMLSTKTANAVFWTLFVPEGSGDVTNEELKDYLRLSEG